MGGEEISFCPFILGLYYNAMVKSRINGNETWDEILLRHGHKKKRVERETRRKKIQQGLMLFPHSLKKVDYQEEVNVISPLLPTPPHPTQEKDGQIGEVWG